MAEVKFCENNFNHSGVKGIKDRVKNELNANVDVEPCLGHCGDCAVSPIAVVDEELVQADTADKLYTKIQNKVQQKVMS
ncbi:hypothetical protein JCM16358_01400 [Halanaerocella petrolearia]